MKRIELFWDDEAKTIIRYDFEHGWTWADLEAAIEAQNALLVDIAREVSVIAVQKYPQHYMPAHPLSKIGSLLPRRSPQVGLIVIVTHSSLVSSVMHLITKLYPSAANMRFTHTIAEARNMIRLYTIQKDY